MWGRFGVVVVWARGWMVELWWTGWLGWVLTREKPQKECWLMMVLFGWYWDGQGPWGSGLWPLLFALDNQQQEQKQESRDEVVWREKCPCCTCLSGGCCVVVACWLSATLSALLLSR